MNKKNIKKLNSYYKQLFKEAFYDLKTKGRRARQIPNILTFMRILAPFFIIPAAMLKNVSLIAIFVAFFSLTDAVDGFIARRYNFVSELGKDLDAVCDKVFAGTLLLAASFFEPILIVNLVLEAIIAFVNTIAKLQNCDPRSHLIGKAKTCILYPLIGLGYLTNYMNIFGIFVFVFLMTTAMQIATTFTYIYKYREAVHKIKKSNI